MDKKELASRISAYRRKSGLTQKELGEKMAVSDKTISKWENGGSLPDVESLNRLAEIFSCSVDDLMNGECPNKRKLGADKNIESDKRNKIVIISVIAVCVLLILSIGIFSAIYFTTIVSQFKGIYVNVDNGNDYYIVNNFTYNHYYADENGTSLVDKGTWFASGGEAFLGANDVRLVSEDGVTSLASSANSFKKVASERGQNESVDITFENGEKVDLYTVKRGTTCPMPETPQKDGYYFVGWQKKDGESEKSEIYSQNDLQWENAWYVATFSCLHSFDNDFRCVEAVCLKCGYVRPVELDHAYNNNHTCIDRACIRCGKVEQASTEHTFVVIKNQADCLKDGEIQSMCTGCGLVLKEVISALGHNWQNWFVTQKVSCNSKGEEKRTCLRCGKTEIKEIETIPHTLNTIKAVDATCTKDGNTKGSYCTVCSTVFEKCEVINKLGHDLSVWTETKKASCNARGEEKRTCSRCTYSETRETDFVEHNTVIDEEIKPTCTTDGRGSGSHCSLCGQVFEECVIIGKLGHDYQEWKENKKGTCIEKGEERRNCSRCSNFESSITDYGDHVPVVDDKIEPTCTENGRESGTHCSLCGSTIIEGSVISKLGHDFQDWYENRKATCTVKGEEKRNCSRCSEYQTRETDYGEHVVVADDRIEPTCTENGKENASHCSLCGTIISSGDLINKLGHVNVHYNGKEPTCTEIGWQAYDVCSRCNYTTYVELESLGHSYQKTVVDPTCTSAGYTEYVCSRCMDFYYEEPKDALDHDYENGVCSRCGDTLAKRVNENNEPDEDGNYILFGSYPQSLIEDNDVISALNDLAGELPTYSECFAWTAYDYYSAGEVVDYTWFIDIEYEDERYRGVYFISYRAVNALYDINQNGHQRRNGYYINTVYWFKYEPITWRVLSNEDGELFLLCEMAIDGREFFVKSNEPRNIDGETIYNNNYQYSMIREWLNDTFYNIAFSALEQELISLTLVDNSIRSGNPDNNAEYFNNGNNIYACADTSDKVFLLSVQEFTNADYGFGEDVETFSIARQKNCTDYAACQGIYVCHDNSEVSSYNDNDGCDCVGKVNWYLRSANSYSGTISHLATCNGKDLFVGCGAVLGIVPAIKIVFAA